VRGRLLDESYPAAIRGDLLTVTIARLGTNALIRFAPPFLGVIASGLDVTVGRLGVALTVAELGGLSATIIGRLVDHLARRIAMVLGLAGITAGACLAAAGGHVVVFGAGLLVLTLSKLLFDIGQGAWIADHVPFERRSRVVGINESSWALGLLVGVSVMGLVTAATSWRWGYVSAAALTAVMAVVVWRRIGPDVPGRHTPPSEIPGPSSLPPTGGPARLTPAGRLAVLSVAFLAAGSQTMFVTFGTWLDDAHGLSTAQLTAVTFTLGFFELAASSLSTARTDRWGKERSVVGGGVMMLLAGALFAVANGFLPVALPLLVLFIAFFEFSIVSAIPIGGDLVPGRPGAGLSRFLTAVTLGRAAAIIPATALFQRYGIAACAIIAAAFGACVAASMQARRARV